MTDIRLRAAAALQSQIARPGEVLTLLDAAIASAPIGLALLDTNLRHTYVNECFAAVNDVPARAHLGRTLWEVAPGIAASVRALLRCTLQTGTPLVDVEVNGALLGRPAEERRWLANIYPVGKENGTVLGLAILLTEVTAQRRAEEALRVNEARFRLATRATRDVIFDWNIITDELLWGDTITAAFGYEPWEVEANIDWWLGRIHPDDAPRVNANLRRALESDAAPWSVEYRFKRRDGSYATVLDRGYLVRDEMGRPMRLVGSLIDFTEQKELEEKLRHAQKMEAVGRLAGGVAHDFNNLLTAIKVHAELALEETSLAAEVREDLQEIQKAAVRAASLTSQLLAFSRRQLIQPQVIDLNAIIWRIDPLLRRLIGEDIEVRTRLASELGQVLADPGQIEQVLMNLAVNARDAMPSGGTITLATEDTDIAEHDPERPAGVAPGPYVTLTVADTGCGVSDEVRARIFEPYFTTKEIGKGTGLGLSTVYGIVEQAGGHIEVSSEPGEGATFTIYLPRMTEAVATLQPAPVAAERPRGSETVLVVEDEHAVRSLTRRILERQGYTVLEARNGREAMMVATVHEGHIHLVLTDLVMPGMSGRMLGEELAAARPGLRVLHMSGYTDDEILRRGLLTSGVSFLQKPFTADSLARAVREALEAPAPSTMNRSPG